MPRQSKRNGHSNRPKTEKERRKSKGGERPANRHVLFILFIAIPLLLAAALAWQRLGPGGGDEVKSKPSANTALPAEGSEADQTNTSQQPAARAVPTSETIAREGLEITFSITPAPDERGQTGGPENDFAEIRFTFVDASSGKPAEPLSPPAVWIDLEKTPSGNNATEALTCQDKVRLYAGGTIGFRPDVDMNSYFILAMNSDATISVIDPLVGINSISQLYSMIFLKSRGEDWVLSSDQKWLFVSMPEADQVAVVDTGSFKVLKNIDAGANPTRLSMQPDGRYLWVSNEPADGKKSGVTVIDTRDLEAIAQVVTGSGPHEITFVGDVTAFPDDGDHASSRHEPVPAGHTHYAFVTNRNEGTVSVVDAHSLKKIKDIKVGKLPTGLDFSSESYAVYVGSEADGVITVIDGLDLEIVDRIDATKGIKALRFAPGGRWGFAVGGEGNTVEVLDASTNSIAHSVEIAGEPDSVSFTDGYAYVRATATAEVSLIDLSQLGQPDTLPVSQIIGGQKAPKESPFRAVASPLVPIHEHGNHVLIANPADSYIYYYMEGMKAPMGGFQNYGRIPTAVGVIDRGIRQTALGVYTAKVRLPQSGQYQAAFLLDSPRITQCFSFTADPNSAVEDADIGSTLEMKVLSEARETRVGEALTLRFSLVNARTRQPVQGLDDVQVVETLMSGLWSERYRAVPVGEGAYEARLTFPRPGAYSVRFAIPSLKVNFDRLPSLTLTATASEKSK